MLVRNGAMRGSAARMVLRRGRRDDGMNPQWALGITSMAIEEGPAQWRA